MKLRKEIETETMANKNKQSLSLLMILIKFDTWLVEQGVLLLIKTVQSWISRKKQMIQKILI